MTFRSSVLALASFLLFKSDAFAPSSTFVHRTSSLSGASPSTSIFPSTPMRAALRGEVSMNLFDRFMRVAKGNVRTVLQSLEDPEKIMSQALTDMQTDLTKVRQSYAEVTASQRRLLKRKEQAESVGDDWYRRAQLALKENNEPLARVALSKRQLQLDFLKELQSQIDTQTSSMDKLYEGMSALEDKILEAKAKKDQYVARAKTAKSTQQVNDMLSGLTGKTSMDAFIRMEEKVEALEAVAEASAEMGRLNINALPTSKDVEKEFARLEASSAVDKELKQMKKLLVGSTTSTTSSKSAEYLEM